MQCWYGILEFEVKVFLFVQIDPWLKVDNINDNEINQIAFKDSTKIYC